MFMIRIVSGASYSQSELCADLQLLRAPIKIANKHLHPLYSVLVLKSKYVTSSQACFRWSAAMVSFFAHIFPLVFLFFLFSLAQVSRGREMQIISCDVPQYRHAVMHKYLDIVFDEPKIATLVKSTHRIAQLTSSTHYSHFFYFQSFFPSPPFPPVAIRDWRSDWRVIESNERYLALAPSS